MIQTRFLFVVIFGFLFSFVLIPQISASEDTQIRLSITGESVIYLDSGNRLLRANVEVENFDPRDGIYTVKVIQLSTQEVISEQEIFVKTRPNDMWGTDIAYLVEESDLGDEPIGEYQMVLETEYDSHTSSQTFTIVKESLSELENLTASNDETEESEQSIPEWVREVFVWYGEKQITEDQLIEAIKFLIQEGIIVV